MPTLAASPAPIPAPRLAVTRVFFQLFSFFARTEISFPLPVLFACRELSATSAFTVVVLSITDTPAPADTAIMPAAKDAEMFCVWLLPRCSALISALPSKTAFTLSSFALMVPVYLWRIMLSPEAIPILAPEAAAAKDRAEDPCLAVASTVRFLAYTFFFALAEVEEISASVVRS